MVYEFRLPDLGEGIAEAEIRRWLVHPGQRVKEHQGLVEVETDKAVVEVPSPRDGVVARLRRDEGDVVSVGDVLLDIGDGEEKVPSRERAAGIVGVLPEAPEEPPSAGEMLVRATPAVRVMAREMGISLQGIVGSGPHGSITREDLLSSRRTAEPASDEFGPVEKVPFRGIRRTIARNLKSSQQITAAVTTMAEADVSDLWQMKEREGQELAEKGIHLTILPFVIKAIQHALYEHPYLNASLDEERSEIVLRKYCHVGVAVDTAEGLMVPVIRDVEKKSVLELAEELQRLGERARTRALKLEEMKGSSITVTNYGHYGGSHATPIINYPDAAILGCGKIADRPWVVKGQIAIRKILPLSLTFDHRLSDGADAAKFLDRIVHFLEDPPRLFIESV